MDDVAGWHVVSHLSGGLTGFDHGPQCGGRERVRLGAQVVGRPERKQLADDRVVPQFADQIEKRRLELGERADTGRHPRRAFAGEAIATRQCDRDDQLVAASQLAEGRSPRHAGGFGHRPDGQLTDPVPVQPVVAGPNQPVPHAIRLGPPAGADLGVGRIYRMHSADANVTQTTSTMVL
jgi:hypothetical protein